MRGGEQQGNREDEGSANEMMWPGYVPPSVYVEVVAKREARENSIVPAGCGAHRYDKWL